MKKKPIIEYIDPKLPPEIEKWLEMYEKIHKETMDRLFYDLIMYGECNYNELNTNDLKEQRRK